MAAVASDVSSVSDIRHFINGKLVNGIGSRVKDVYNPAIGTVSGKVRIANRADVDSAVEAAKRASALWADVSLTKRMGVLFVFVQKLAAATDRLARVITAEHGKVLSDAKGEISRGLETVQFACGLIDHLKGQYSSQVSAEIDVYSVREPLGVVAGITPFNFPVMVPLWMAPVAIACGNAFILKPSERDPSASLVLAELWQDAGLPDGVFNVLQGDKEAVDALLTHPDVAAVSFVGSTPIAKYVHGVATANGKRVQALGGAKNHAIVLPDADLDLAADYLSSAAFGSAGERCMAISVGVAVGNTADRLAEKLTKRAGGVVVDEGTNPDANMGPLITGAAKERVTRIIGEAEAAGASLVRDGRKLVVSGHENGFFVGPTVIDRVKPEMSAYTEEIFGPVLSMVRADDVDSAIALINRNPYGNGVGIFTQSGANARKFQRAVKVGMVGINVPIPVPISWYSFGGWNNSLFGDLHIYGPDGFQFYTRNKVITQRWLSATQTSDASFAFPTHK